MIFLFLLFPSILSAQVIQPEQGKLPQFELGVAAIFARAPHYPGSDEYNSVALPFPTIIYRGDVIRADEDGGLRGRFLHSDRYELNLSVGGALAARTEDNDDRQGMPSLDPMLEFGPGFIYHFTPKGKDNKFKLSINLPIRYVISSDFSDTRHRGYVFNPVLFSFYKFNENFTLFTSITGRWATKRFNDYIYSVDNKFANAGRPQYAAESGQVLYSYTAALIYNRGDNFSVFTGFSYENYKDSANKRSPLFIREDNMSAVLGIVYWFYEKEELNLF